MPPTKIMLAIAAASALACAGAASAETIYDVEGARANARAGGPISEYDAWLLERWGASSGTPDWRRQRGYTFREAEDYAPRKRIKRSERYRY